MRKPAANVQATYYLFSNQDVFPSVLNVVIKVMNIVNANIPNSHNVANANALSSPEEMRAD